jgi:hypothetical protein
MWAVEKLAGNCLQKIMYEQVEKSASKSVVIVEDATDLISEDGREEAKNRPNIDWQEKIHRGILRGLRNISETP